MSRTPASASRRSLLGYTLASGLASAMPAALRAQERPYPNKTVRIVIPYAAGGAGDVVTRIVAERLSARLGQTFVSENRPGAGGVTGAQYVARAPADGYTVAFSAIAFNLITSMYPNLNFDPGKVLVPVSLLITQPYVLLIRSDAPFKNLAELIAYAKARPGEVNLAHAGVGTLIHLFGVWLASVAGIKFNEIPYSGSAPALNSLLAGQTDVYFDPPSNSLQHLPGGRIRAIAVTGVERLPVLKDVPTLRELGVPISGATWFGIHVPQGTPVPIIQKLNTEINAVLREPDVRSRLEAMHYKVESTTPEQFGRFFEEQTTNWTKIIKDAGIKGA